MATNKRPRTLHHPLPPRPRWPAAVVVAGKHRKLSLCRIKPWDRERDLPKDDCRSRNEMEHQTQPLSCPIVGCCGSIPATAGLDLRQRDKHGQGAAERLDISGRVRMETVVSSSGREMSKSGGWRWFLGGLVGWASLKNPTATWLASPAATTNGRMVTRRLASSRRC